ncbi:ribonuclease inhibitor [Streptomyces sp. NPDC048172]|uniref:ribonuclease inhibitor n=1 Tax=Streptomyces sp. NPDC048172 TaxID=3365505 RepID=UPI0037102BC6
MSGQGGPGVPGGSVAPVGLEPLLAWLRAGHTAGERVDFPAGTVLPDGRLDLCKSQIGPAGAALVVDALRTRAEVEGEGGADGEGAAPGAIRHLLLGTDGLGDDGAAEVAARRAGTGVQTLYLGCNGISGTGACRIADQLRASPQAVAGLWLKRNPLGGLAGHAGAELVAAAPGLSTLDLVQTGLDAPGAARLTRAVLDSGRRFERLYLGGNPLGPTGAEALAPLLEAGVLDELYLSAAGLGDPGARTVAEGLRRAPRGRLRRLSLASDGLGAAAGAELVTAAAAADVELLDLGRVKAAAVLGAPDNRVDTEAATTIAATLSAGPHRLRHLVLSDTGMRSAQALPLLAGAERAVTPTRFVLGKGIATSVRRRLDALSAEVPWPVVPRAVAAVRSVHRTPPPGLS